MKLFTFDDAGDLALLALSSDLAPSWCRNEILRKRIGDLDYLVRRGRRRVVIRSMAQALPEKCASEIQALARRCFERRWLDREIYWLRLADRVPVTIRGLDHLRAALNRKKGAILWESPLGFRILGTRALVEQGFPITQVHGPAHGGGPSVAGQRFFRRIHRTAEARLLPDVVRIQEASTSYVDALMKRLRENAIVCMAGFGPMGSRFVPLDFLGVRQYFATGIISLALVSGAALIPVFCYRESDGVQHLSLEQPVPLPSGRNRQELYTEALESHSRMLADYVKRYPSQWSRWHAPLTSVDASKAISE